MFFIYGFILTLFQTKTIKRLEKVGFEAEKLFITIQIDVKTLKNRRTIYPKNWSYSWVRILVNQCLNLILPFFIKLCVTTHCYHLSNFIFYNFNKKMGRFTKINATLQQVF